MFLIAVSLSVVGQMLVIYFPPLQKIFQTESLFLKGKKKTILMTFITATKKSLFNPWHNQDSVGGFHVPMHCMRSTQV